MRGNISSVIIGRRRTGKSTLLNKLAEKYASGTGKKALVLDVNGAPAYKHHQLLTKKNFALWCNGNYNGVKRFYLSDNDEMMAMVIEHFRNGAVFLEDCTKYIDKNPNKLVKTFLSDCRMWNADLFFTFHSLVIVPVFFWTMTNKVFVLRTNDILKGRDGFFERRVPNYHAIKEAMLKQRHSKEEFPEAVVIDTDI